MHSSKAFVCQKLYGIPNKPWLLFINIWICGRISASEMCCLTFNDKIISEDSVLRGPLIRESILNLSLQLERERESEGRRGREWESERGSNLAISKQSLSCLCPLSLSLMLISCKLEKQENGDVGVYLNLMQPFPKWICPQFLGTNC